METNWLELDWYAPKNGTAVLKGLSRKREERERRAMRRRQKTSTTSSPSHHIRCVRPPINRYCLNPSTAVPFWGQSSQIPSSLSPKRDCGTKRVERENRLGKSSHARRATIGGYNTFCPPRQICLAVRAPSPNFVGMPFFLFYKNISWLYLLLLIVIVWTLESFIGLQFHFTSWIVLVAFC